MRRFQCRQVAVVPFEHVRGRRQDLEILRRQRRLRIGCQRPSAATATRRRSFHDCAAYASRPRFSSPTRSAMRVLARHSMSGPGSARADRRVGGPRQPPTRMKRVPPSRPPRRKSNRAARAHRRSCCGRTTEAPFGPTRCIRLHRHDVGRTRAPDRNALDDRRDRNEAKATARCSSRRVLRFARSSTSRVAFAE
jgi:hypothetical protein